jgi:hypothetical protein
MLLEEGVQQVEPHPNVSTQPTPSDASCLQERKHLDGCALVPSLADTAALLTPTTA